MLNFKIAPRAGLRINLRKAYSEETDAPSFFVLLPLVAAGPAFAADCTKDVVAAFEKQRTSKAFRVEFSQPTAEGEAQMRVDYIPPDKMLQTVTSPAMPGEQQTMLVGDRAFAGTSGSFEELRPQFTQSIVAEVKQALGASPQKLGSFECLGAAKLDNRDLVAYRTAEKIPWSGPGKSHGADDLCRSGDRASGVQRRSRPGGTADPVMKVKYSYPTDIEIVAPANAPVQKLR